MPAATIAGIHHLEAGPTWAFQAHPSASAAKSGIGFGFQMNVDFLDRRGRDGHEQAGDGRRDRPADQAGEPPGRPDRGDTQDGDPGDDRGRVGAAQPGGRGEKVVVGRAVVEVADRGRRPEQRQRAVPDEAEQDQDVVALVPVEPAPRLESREPDDGRESEQPDQDDDVALEGSPHGLPETPTRPAQPAARRARARDDGSPRDPKRVRHDRGAGRSVQRLVAAGGAKRAAR